MSTVWFIIPIIIIIIYFRYLNVEHRKHNDNLNQLYRIHVNGIRGKTTITRMIGTVMRENGFSCFTKTTGSKPVMILPNGEEKLIGRQMSARIGEQIETVQKAIDENSDMLVIECMALDPYTQGALERSIIKSDIGIITNVRYDHQDVMGNSLEEIATSLSNTVPTDGKLIMMDNIDHKDIFIDKAIRNNCSVYFAEESDVPQGYTDKFSFTNFNDNVAVVLKVCELMNIDRTDALDAMLKTNHDIGKTDIYERIYKGNKITFVNAFANNDVNSVNLLFSLIRDIIENKHTIAILNTRSDRIFRSINFIPLLIDRFDKIVLIGDDKKMIKKKIQEAGYDGTIFISNNGIQDILDVSPNNTICIGLANIKNTENILEFFGVT